MQKKSKIRNSGSSSKCSLSKHNNYSQKFCFKWGTVGWDKRGISLLESRGFLVFVFKVIASVQCYLRSRVLSCW